MVSNQIVKINGKNKLIEFLDDLSVARTEFYAYQHSGTGEKRDREGWNDYSRIKVRILDYSAKNNGGESVMSAFNLTPGQIRRLAKDAFAVPERYEAYKNAQKVLEAVNESNEKSIDAMYQNSLLINRKLTVIAGMLLKLFDNPDAVLNDNQKQKLKALPTECTVKPVALEPFRYSFSQEKISVVQNSDKGIVTKLYVNFDSSKNQPWLIKIENGTGTPIETETGGTACKAGSFKSESSTFIMLKTADFQEAMLRVVSFIDTFETVNAKSVRMGKEQYASELKEQNAERQKTN